MATPPSNHIILCGLGKIGYSVLELLHELDEPVVVVTRDIPAEWRSRVESLAARVIIGDARLEEVLLESGIRKARSIVICTNDDLANLEIALDSKRLAPDAGVVLRLYDLELADRVRRDLDVRAVLNAADLAAPAFVAAALGDEVLRSFDIHDTFVSIISLPISDEMSGEGMTLGALAARMDVTPLALDQGEGHRSASLTLKTTLASGDKVVVAATKTALAALQHSTEFRFGFSHEHSGEDHDNHSVTGRRVWERQHLSVRGIFGLVPRIWSNASRPLRTAFLTLNSLVMVSVLVFHFGWNLNWINSFYFTIATMTTVGFGDIHLLNAPPIIKLFGCAIMVAGAALLVVFYSVITDYIVSQRFEQVLGRKKAALEGHIVVVGLGNVGFRVALRLHELGEPVLAIERDEKSGYVSDLPKEIPILYGDATQNQLLDSAGVGKARAVVAATNNDLVNVRIAQRVEAVNPEVRTIVRLFQTSLANKLGASILGINLPLNPSQASAATFAACALAPDVLQGFTLGKNLYLLRWMDAASLPKCIDKNVKDLRDNFGVLVLLRQRKGSAILEEIGGHDNIHLGDRLVVLEEYDPATDKPSPCKVVQMDMDQAVTMQAAAPAGR